MKVDKNIFISEDWVEGRHEYLKKLSKRQASSLLKTLTRDEIDLNINCRLHQEAYICDFLEEVWGINHSSFWDHIHIGLKHPNGVVLSDNDFHIMIMVNEKMPTAVFKELLETINRLGVGDNYFFETHVEIALAQIMKSNRFSGIYKKWYELLDNSKKKIVDKYIKGIKND